MDRLLDSAEFRALLDDHPRSRVLSATREVLREIREGIGVGGEKAIPGTAEAYARRVGDRKSVV